MKVLMLGWGFPPDIDGGLDIHVAEVFKHLRKNEEVRIDLALPKSRAPSLENVIPIETGDGDMIDRSRIMSQEVAEIAEEYDIIHTHDWFGAEAGFKSKKYSDVKWVSTFHSLSSGRSRTPSKRLERMEKAAAEESDVLISVSESLAEEVNEKYSRQPEVIYNGYEKPETHGKDVKSDLGIEGEMIFYVGRHAEQKRIELLIRAFEKLDRGTLVLGGTGHMKNALEQFVELLGIEDSVRFVGFIPDSELGDYYSSADVFVSPSRNEPFGLTITEAACCGTPVVATESGALEILPEQTYFKAEGNSDSLKENIEKALETDVEIATERSWKSSSEKIYRIYEDITSISSTSPRCKT
ncbi:glycosyltransferase family 4 protein [Candidatus Nanohalococcus occultus]|uniref:glycosyltransferase family 4 protein n=1 Tax=Candidatus Nanohalococcus occultus TaxID=2978047 RepID=UPI0039E0E076